MRMALNRAQSRAFWPGRAAFCVSVSAFTLATVVAGSIRLAAGATNYTVIGDGVNVASRLQALTRKPGATRRSS